MKNNKIQILVAMICAFFLVVFSSYHKSIRIILFIFLIIIIKCLLNNKQKFKLIPFFNALVLAIFVVIGCIYDKAGTIMVLGSGLNGLKTLIYLGCLTFLLYLILNYIFNFKNEAKKWKKNKEQKKFLDFIFYKHPFFSMGMISIGISFIYLIFFYPGSVSFDGIWQLNAYFKTWDWNNHHPALLSMIMGNFFKLGKGIRDANLGIFIYIFMQVIINGLILGYIFKIMNKINSPMILRIITAIFFFVFPFWTINSITYIKDTIYYLVFLFIFTFQYYHLFILKEKKIKNWVILFIMYTVLYLWRNTGFYIALINLGLLMIYFFKDKVIFRGLLVVFIGILGINIFYHHVFLPYFNIKEGSIREMMSIPLQQTARYIKYYPQDIEKQEQQRLEILFTEDIYNLGNIYEPNRSDNVKAQILDYPTKEQLSEYFKAWWSMFLKHPLVYVDATLNNIYGYFYSEHKNFIGEEVGFYNIVNYELPEIEFNPKFEVPRNKIYKIARIWCDMPVTGLLYSCYPYVWFLITLCFYLLYKKNYRFLIALNPFLVTILLCVMSPVNGHMRYLQPLVVSVPIIIAFFIYENKKAIAFSNAK